MEHIEGTLGAFSEPDEGSALVDPIPTADSSEAELLEKLFAEFDAIDARIAERQKNIRALEHDNKKVLAELGEIVARLWAG